MSTLKLWLVRHGETAINTGAWSAHPNDTHLTPRGIGQARDAAAQIEMPPDLLVVSPLVRAVETADCITSRWPQSPRVTWPIEELVYLSPPRLAAMDADARKAYIRDYWERAQPEYCDGEGAESFVAFLARVEAFHQALQRLTAEFVVVVGHGQFLAAFLRGLTHGFQASPDWMRAFRAQETTNPIPNGAINRLDLPL